MFKKSLADAVENIATFNQDVADSSIICLIAVQNQQWFNWKSYALFLLDSGNGNLTRGCRSVKASWAKDFHGLKRKAKKTLTRSQNNWLLPLLGVN